MVSIRYMFTIFLNNDTIKKMKFIKENIDE